jgi:DNA-cytosine methyltransferase
MVGGELPEPRGRQQLQADEEPVTDEINVELFSCSGGMSMGFRRAGVEFDIVVEWLPDHCDSYEKNIGHRPLCMDVRDFARLVRAGGIRKPVQLLVADPPCTPWSRAGKRLGTEDTRDMLGETCALIELLQPRTFVIGNVPGLDDGPNLHIVRRLIGGLSQHGYCVADFARLDAAAYGVPQHRVRPFWFGHKHGPCIQWPVPTHGDPKELRDQFTLPGIQALIPWVTCRQALGHLPLEQLGRPVKLRKREDAPKEADEFTIQDGRGGLGGLNHLDEPSHSVVTNTHGNAMLLNTSSKHPPSQIDEPSTTVKASSGGGSKMALQLDGESPRKAGMRKRDIGRVPQAQRVGDPDSAAKTIDTRTSSSEAKVLTWPWDRPATTIQADDRLSPGHHDESFAVRSLPNAIVISELAATILQGFPPDWAFLATSKDKRFSMLGQAMPIPLAHAVATSVVAQREATIVQQKLEHDAHGGVVREAKVIPISKSQHKTK